jgi:hypothetical protein
VNNHDALDHDGDLVGFLRGDLGRAESIEIARHLKTCSPCTEQLVDLAFVHGALTSASRVGNDLDGTRGIASGEPALDRFPGGPDLGREELPAMELSSRATARARPTGARSRRRQLSVAGIAAAIVVLGGLGVAVVRSSGTPKNPVVVQAALRPLDAPANTKGSVTVVADGTTRELTVRTQGLPNPPSQSFYEVWLLDSATLKMLPMGVLSPSGSGTYAVGANIMAGYSAVDVSLQANDGDPAHSKVSVLRASYGTATT